MQAIPTLNNALQTVLKKSPGTSKLVHTRPLTGGSQESGIVKHRKEHCGAILTIVSPI